MFRKYAGVYFRLKIGKSFMYIRNSENSHHRELVSNFKDTYLLTAFYKQKKKGKLEIMDALNVIQMYPDDIAYKFDTFHFIYSVINYQQIRNKTFYLHTKCFRVITFPPISYCKNEANPSLSHE